MRGETRRLVAERSRKPDIAELDCRLSYVNSPRTRLRFPGRARCHLRHVLDRAAYWRGGWTRAAIGGIAGV